MHLIDHAKIQIAPNRQRQEFDPQHLQDLADSISTRGLFHAPVLRETPEGFFLVAGERRLRAMKLIWELAGTFNYSGQVIPAGKVPYVTLGELSRLDAEEAELDENLRRRDLTWQEHANAMQRLHKLRTEQKEAASLPAHTVADTAKEIHGRSDGAYQGQIRKELIVANHLDKPEVAAAKTVDEAFKILKKQEEVERNKQLALSVGATFTANIHIIKNMDCLQGMRELEPGSVDVIVTDPPYGMNAQAFGDSAGRMTVVDHDYDDSPESWRALMTAWAPLSYQVTKAEAHAYVFCDFDKFHELKEMMQAAGWYVFRTPLIYYKTDGGRVPLPDRGPRRCYECILYAIKGNKPVTHIYPDVVHSTSDNKGNEHGAGKSVAAISNLLQRSVRPGDVVLDSFLGSGTLIEAAHAYKCKVVGFELNPAYYAQCVKLLSALK